MYRAYFVRVPLGTEAVPDLSKKSFALLRTLSESKGCWPHLAAAGLLSLLSLPLTLLYPLPLKIAVDTALHHEPLPPFMRGLLPKVSATPAMALVYAAALVLALAIIVNVQSLLAWWLQTYIGEKLVWDFRAKLLNHVQRLPLSFHDQYGPSDSVYRIQHDAPAIQYVTVQGLIPLMTAVVTLGGMVYVIVRIDPWLALVALTITPILLVLAYSCGRLVRQRSQRVKELDSSAMSVIQEVLGCIRVIKAFGQEDREHARFVRRSDQRVTGQIKLALFQALFNVLIGMTIAGGTATVLYVGVQHVRGGVLTEGSFLVVMAYLAQMYQPLQLIAGKTTDLQAWITALERTFLLLDQEPEIAEHPHALALSNARGAFEFRNVSFRYAAKHDGLKNISCTISAGSRVGIVGSTGAGKTTLLNLITRFYDPSDGVIRLDGTDLRQYRIADLRRQFGVVLQEPLLFNASLAENIAYGKRDASDDEITAAAKAACAHEFIMALPNGYATMVGERGSTLSGGERQRVSLARAFLRNSPILILDEPTSSVDRRTEKSILAATEALMEGRTTFMIAHRLDTLRTCNLILILDKGELIEARTTSGSGNDLEPSGLERLVKEFEASAPRV